MCISTDDLGSLRSSFEIAAIDRVNLIVLQTLPKRFGLSNTGIIQWGIGNSEGSIVMQPGNRMPVAQQVNSHFYAHHSSAGWSPFLYNSNPIQ